VEKPAVKSKKVNLPDKMQTASKTPAFPSSPGSKSNYMPKRSRPSRKLGLPKNSVWSADRKNSIRNTNAHILHTIFVVFMQRQIGIRKARPHLKHSGEDCNPRRKAGCQDTHTHSTTTRYTHSIDKRHIARTQNRTTTRRVRQINPALIVPGLPVL